MHRTVILTLEEEVEALAAPWRALQEACALSPFTGYDFAMCWWQEIGKPSGASLYVAVCYDGEELAGIVPFSVRAKGGVRVLRLLGNEIFYYRGFLIRGPEACESLWRTVWQSEGFDVASIKNIHEGTPEDALFSEKFKPFRVSRAHRILHEGGPWAGGIAAALPALPKSLRRRVRRAQERLGPAGDLSFGAAYALADMTPEAREALAFMLARKKEWVREKGRRSFFDEAGHAAFFEKTVELLMPRGGALLCWLKEGGRLVAASLSYIEKGFVYAHTIAFDRAGAPWGAGNILTAQELALAAENGFLETNFMEGQDEYIAAFAPSFLVTKEYLLARTLKGKLYLLLYRVKEALKTRMHG